MIATRRQAFRESFRAAWAIFTRAYKAMRRINLENGMMYEIPVSYKIVVKAPFVMGKDVIYMPTPVATAKKMVAMASIKLGDKHLDIGSGDGRLCVEASNAGATSTGYELNPKLIQEARLSAANSKTPYPISFEEKDFMDSSVDFSKFDVITLFLLPKLNMALRPRLQACKPGTRIVSHAFDMGDWKPDEVQPSGDGKNFIFLWVVK